jgi:ADP-ribose pyrophosphatase YjhB (NUDIX family)
MERRVCVRGIILKDSKLFAVRQNNSAGEEVDYWCTPGGGLDIGESILDGLSREIIEETGIKPVIGKLLLIQQFIDPKGREQLELFFEVTNPDDFTNIDLSNTTHGEIELLDFGFVDPKNTYLMPKILSEVELLKIEQPILINELS